MIECSSRCTSKYIQTILDNAEDASEEHDQQIDEPSEKYEDAEQKKVKYVKAIQENKHKILHERDVERRAEQQRAEEEQNETNIRSLKCMRNIMDILFREDADTSLNLIKNIEEPKTANLMKEWNKYLKNQLDQCFKAQQL